MILLDQTRLAKKVRRVIWNLTAYAFFEMTDKEAAEGFGVSVSTIRRSRATGKNPQRIATVAERRLGSRVTPRRRAGRRCD